MNNNTNSMYNPDQKKGYISCCLLNSNSDNRDAYKLYFINFFKRLGVYEYKYKQDFADLDLELMNKIMTEFINGTINYQRSALTQLTQYVTWAIENKKSRLEINPLSGLTLKDLKLDLSCANIMVSSIKDLEKCLDDSLAAYKEDQVDNLYRAFYMLLFDGVFVDDVINLKEEQINITDKTVQLEARKVLLCKETSAVVEYVLKQTVFVSNISRGVKIYPIVKTGYLLENSRTDKGSPSDNVREVFYKSFKSAASLKLKKASKDLTPSRVVMSGIFYRMSLQEKRGENISFDECFEFKKDKKMAVLLPESAKEKWADEYQIWKNTFL